MGGGTSFRDCDHCVMKFKKMFGQNIMLDLKMVLQWPNHFLITIYVSEQEIYMYTCARSELRSLSIVPGCEQRCNGQFRAIWDARSFSLHQFEYFDIKCMNFVSGGI